MKNEMRAVNSQKLLSSRNLQSVVPDLEHSLLSPQPLGYCTTHETMNSLLGAEETTRDVLYKLSKTSYFPSTTWLWYFDDNSRETNSTWERFFNDIDLRFDMEFLVAPVQGHIVRLLEVYKVTEDGPLQKQELGYWVHLPAESSGHHDNSSDQRTSAVSSTPVRPATGMYERRNSLHGAVIRTLVIQSLPTSFAMLQGGKFHLRGILGELWEHLELSMNFTSEVSLQTDGMYGTESENGSWSGAMEKLVGGEVHMILGTTPVTNQHQAVIGFSKSLHTLSYVILVKTEKSSKVRWESFTKPFSFGVRLAIIVSTLVIASSLGMFHYLGFRYGNKELRWKTRHFSTYEAFFSIGGAIFCGQAYPMIPISIPCRLLYLTSYTLNVVLVGAYSASLVSFFAVPETSLSFHTAEQLVSDASYKLGVVADSNLFTILRTSSDATLRSLYSIIESDYPTTDLQGLQRLCAREKYAFMTAIVTSETFLRSLNCSVVVIPKAVYHVTVALAFTKSWPYAGIFNFNLEKMWESGVTKRLKNKYFPSGLTDIVDHEVTVGLWDIVPLLANLGVGAITAILVLALELLYHHLLCPCDRHLGSSSGATVPPPAVSL